MIDQDRLTLDLNRSSLRDKLGIGRGAEDGIKDGSASPKVLKTASKMAAEMASKMAWHLVLCSALTKGLKTALMKIDVEMASKIARGWVATQYQQRV
jgi:hypothetical protein